MIASPNLRNGIPQEPRFSTAGETGLSIIPFLLVRIEMATGQKKGKMIALWVLRVVVGLVFLAAGGSKLAGAPAMVAMFSKIGNRELRVVKAPHELHPFYFLMAWHPRLNSDPRHVWLREAMRSLQSHAEVKHSNPGQRARAGLFQ
jgi:hypothetical protein